MGFEEIFTYIGQFGHYQMFLFLMLGLPSLFTGYQNMAMIFLGPDHDHFCSVPRLQNFSYAQQKYIGIPWEDSRGAYSRCYYYDLPYHNLTDGDLIAWNRSNIPESVAEKRCDQGWIFDQSEFVVTVVSKWDLVCTDSWKNQLVSTIYLMGMLVGAASSGAISDRFGRQKTLVLMSTLFLIISVGGAFVENYWVFTIMRLLVAASGHGAYLCAFVIIMEVIGPKYRTVAAVMFQEFFALGFILLPFIAYYVRDSTMLQVAMGAPVIITFSYIFLIPESPRWLLSRGLYARAERVIQKICAVNEKEVPHDVVGTLVKSMDEPPKGSYADLFRYPNLRKEILIVYFNWFTNNLLYYGFSLNTGTLAGSLYINTLLSALVEVPAKIIALAMLHFWGRRACVAISELTSAAASAVCIILILVNNDSLAWMLTLFTMIGKMGITASFSGIYVFTAELFPTPIRHLAVGSSSMMSRISGLLAPFMGEPMMKIWEPLPSLVFGLFALVAGSTALLLPETRGVKMPDTIEEAEMIGMKKTEVDVEGKDNKAYEADRNGHVTDGNTTSKQTLADLESANHSTSVADKKERDQESTQL